MQRSIALKTHESLLAFVLLELDAILQLLLLLIEIDVSQDLVLLDGLLGLLHDIFDILR